MEGSVPHWRRNGYGSCCQCRARLRLMNRFFMTAPREFCLLGLRSQATVLLAQVFKWLNPFSVKYGPDLLAVIRLQYSYLLKTFHKYFSVFLPGPGNRLANTRLAASLRFSQPYEVVHKTWRLLFQPCPIDSRRARNERSAQSRLETAMLFPAPFALPIFLLPSFLLLAFAFFRKCRFLLLLPLLKVVLYI